MNKIFHFINDNSDVKCHQYSVASTLREMFLDGLYDGDVDKYKMGATISSKVMMSINTNHTIFVFDDGSVIFHDNRLTYADDMNPFDDKATFVEFIKNHHLINESMFSRVVSTLNF